MSAPATAPAMVNVDALRRTVAAIEAHPHLWDQQVFSATAGRGRRAHCFASWVVTLAGFDIPDLLAQAPDGGALYRLARDILGLTDRQAWKLFLYTEDDDGNHPTVAEFKIRITAITGVALP